MATILTVTDSKGISVSTWGKENITLVAGDTLEQNSLGGVSFKGKMLNLGKDILGKLIAHKRVEVMN